jgi:hypothetical protein
MKYYTNKIQKAYKRIAAVLLAMMFMVTPVFAADDPLATINNLSDFVFSAIRAIGIILLGWGIVQIGMSLQSHDPSQRTNGFMCFFGGILIMMAKAILDLILV